MKKLLVFLMLIVTSFAFCQTTVEPNETTSLFSEMLSFFLPAVIAQALVLFADAKKWFMTNEWSWQYFFASKARPFLYTTIGGMVLYVVLYYLPMSKQFIEVLMGSQLGTITAASLFAAAAAIVDGFTKNKPE